MLPKNVFDATARDLELPAIDPLEQLETIPAFNRLKVFNGFHYLNPSSELASGSIGVGV